MIDLRHARLAVWLAVAALASPVVVQAQQAKPDATDKPATKPKKNAAKPNPKPKPASEAPAAQAALGGAQPSLLGQYGEWGAYAASPAGTKVCFALAKPQESKTTPPGKARDPAYLFIASRPAENVLNEVSVAIGYAFKPGADASVEIGPAKFPMYTHDDGAWIKNAAEEARMVEVMRKGSDLVVTGTSARGTRSTDRYTLKGLSQALDRAAQECK
jgi:invasion protein IalB